MAGGTSAPAAVAGTTASIVSPAAAVGCASTQGDSMGRRLRRRAARLRLVAGAVAFAAATCLAHADAQAGTYSVWAHCYDNHSFTPSSGSAGNLVAHTSCDGAGLPQGMQMHAVPHNDHTHFSREGDAAGFRFAAPAGTRIHGLKWDGTVYEGITSYCAWFCDKGLWRYHSGILGDNPLREFGLHCSTDNLGACASVSGQSIFPKDVQGYSAGLNEGAVAFYVGCSEGPCPSLDRKSVV